MFRRFAHNLNKTLTSAALALLASGVEADGFGIYDSKTLALGGASVAIADPGVAVFYNPARLAQHNYDEDSGRHGRFYFPLTTVQVATSVEDIQDIDDDDLTNRLTNSIEQFNAAPNGTNAAAIVNNSSELLFALDDLRQDSLFVDAFTGLSISEPGDGQGGAFYWGARVVGDGDLAGIDEADLNLLGDYVEGLDFIASGGQRGAPHPELFNDDGTLIDPRDQLVSQTRAAGALINELGLSAAKRFNFWGQPVAFGITPKLQLIKTYDATYDVGDDDLETGRDDTFEQTHNFDLGVATEIGRWNVGLSVKDLISRAVSTPLGREVAIDTKTRLGVGYLGNRFKIGLDYDLTPIAPVASGLEVQELAIGGEWRVIRSIFLRAGYRQDLLGTREDTLSYGLGFYWRRFAMDLSVADGNDLLGFSLQLGFKH